VRYWKRWWIRATLIAWATAALSSCASGPSAHPLMKPYLVRPSQDSASTWSPGSDWKLTWSDDFSGTDSLHDWNLIDGGGGWGHQELEGYSSENVAVGPGGLIITASKDGYGDQCWYGACKYSSGRIDTEGLFQQAYGIFAARIKLPAGRGLWPAFWMESANPVPDGEIDVIETNNQEPHLASGFAHASGINHGAYLQLPTPLSAGYHTYAIEWTQNSLSWLVDGRTYGHTGIPAGAPFDGPFYLILDLAVGGVWPGPPNAETVFPAHMYVSWIHVYSHK
jgi:beta-glucanase (GH16 family)